MSFISNLVGGLVGDLSGANYDANQTGTYYQNALNQFGPGGTAAADKFIPLESAALAPEFAQQNESLKAGLAASGITDSGAAKADFSDLAGEQSAALAGATAPLFQTALSGYSNTLSSEPGAQSEAYGNAINQFYSALKTAATGVPSQATPYADPSQSTYGDQGSYDPYGAGEPLYGQGSSNDNWSPSAGGSGSANA